MKCIFCGKNIYDSMAYCPYCGKQIFDNGFNNKIDLNTSKKLYKEKKYNDLLYRACSGDNVAQYLYFCAVEKEAEKNTFADEPSWFSTLREKSIEQVPFAVAMIALYTYDHNRKDVIPFFLPVHNEAAEKKGAEGILKACEMKCPLAQTRVASWKMKGNEFVTKNEREGFSLMKSSAEQNEPLALYLLGTWYAEGKYGISKNEEYGCELIEKAALFGVPKAQEYLENKQKGYLRIELGEKDKDDEKKDVKITYLLTNPILSISRGKKDFGYDISQGDIVETFICRCQRLNDYYRALDKISELNIDTVQKQNLKKWLDYTITSLKSYDDFLKEKARKEALPISERLKEECHSFSGDFSTLRYYYRYNLQGQDYVNWGRSAEKLREVLAIPVNDEIFFMSDQSTFSNGKSGFAVSTSGIYFSMSYEKVSILFSDLAREYDKYGYKSGYYKFKNKAKTTIVAVYYCDMETWGGQFSKLYEKLYDISKEYDEKKIITSSSEKMSNTSEEHYIVCQLCGKPNRSRARFCAFCGNAFVQKRLCINCGKEIKVGKKFCSGCGTQVKE